MSIDTISDVLTRIGAIQQQMQQLQNGSLLDSALGAPGASSSSGGSSASSSSGTSATDFANQLAAAQDTSAATAAGTGSTTATGASSTTGTDAASTTGTGASSTGTSALLSSLVSALESGASGTSPAPGGTGLGVPSAVTSGVSLPASAGSQLTSGQQQFASTLSAETGLNPGVVSAWLLAEESGGAAQSRQGAGNNDWLNIGYTDSATYGAGDSVWSDPVTAANATAEWLKGQNSIPGYGTASSGIQAILSSVGQTPAAQIQAIQGSGWSSGGYPSLGSLYDQVAGGTNSAGALQ
jgi:hypothetical protein